MTYGAMVLVDADTLVCLCPWHGPVPDAEYTEGTAPCGCSWRMDSHGVLRAHRAEVVVLQQEVPQVDFTRHKGQTT